MCCHPVVSSSLKPHSHLCGWPHSSSAPDKDKTSAAPLIQPPAPHSTVPNKERWHPYTLWLFMETLKPLFEDVPHLFCCWCCCGGGSWKSLCLCPGCLHLTSPRLFPPQRNMEPEPSGGAKCSAAVRRLGSPGSTTGKRKNLYFTCSNQGYLKLAK